MIYITITIVFVAGGVFANLFYHLNSGWFWFPLGLVAGSLATVAQLGKLLWRLKDV